MKQDEEQIIRAVVGIAIGFMLKDIIEKIVDDILENTKLKKEIEVLKKKLNK